MRNCHNYEFVFRKSEWRNTPTTLITSCNIQGCYGAFVQQISQEGDIIGPKPLTYRDLLNLSHFYARNGAPVRCRLWAVATTTLHGARPTHARKEATYNNISRTLLMMSFTRGVPGGGEASDAAAPGVSVQWAATYSKKLRGLSPHANYTDRAAAAGRRS